MSAMATACVGSDGESVELILLPSVVQIDYEVADVLLDSMVGTLAFEDRCVWLVPGNPAESRSIVAWPEGTRYDNDGDEIVHEEDRFRASADFVAVGLLRIADLDESASEVARRCIERSGTSTEVLIAVAPGIEVRGP
ncbi:MAG: hypothetical protein F2534_19460 [Actinobacteria bacterium]|uniref:Unannotated protein n=1 Tax=freshwater metagenome TaxID=449393 RepID=A0A6J6FX70_9ZZZZ|nr:hypothetical protein [Actinomycetota bacterium]